MGRITVFTCCNDTNSLAVCKALADRKLPYVEISLVQHPERAADLKALSGHQSVPRVFFNTRHVGGLDETLQELQRWDKPPAASSFQTPLDRYNAEILPRHDPTNPKLALPPRATSTAATDGLLENLLAAPDKKVLIAPASIRLLDDTETTVHDITEKLRNTLSIMPSTKRRGVVYRRVFTGAHAAKTFETALGLSRGSSLAFGDALLSQNILQACSSNSSTSAGSSGSLLDSLTATSASSSSSGTAVFEDSEQALYRLTSDAQPDILNSYVAWSAAPQDPVRVLVELDKLLHEIEMDSVAADGLLDLTKAFNHSHFSLFQEVVCQVQQMDFGRLPKTEKLPFALNLYNLMLRYAFIKLGIPVSDADRLHFMNSVRFQVSGHLFTFNDWVNGVLRGNARSPATGKVPFGRGDARRAFALKHQRVLDRRIHYAINVGPHLGNRAGLPFQRFTSQNIDKELDIAGHVFWEDDANLEVNVEGKEIKIPRVLAWYRGDFAGNLPKMVEKLAEHMLISQIRDVQKVSSKNKITFLEPNWARNARAFARYDKETIVAEEKGVKAAIRRRLKSPRLPDNESLRMATLTKLNILDSLPDERFDRITRMVQNTFATTMVAVSFVDNERCWLKSAQMPMPVKDAPKELPRDTAICAHVILQNSVMVVPDLLQDDRFADHPGAQAMGIRFYAGCPLSVPDGSGGMVNVGTLCILDTKPRHFTEKDEETMKFYADRVRDELLSQRGGKLPKQLAESCPCAC